MGILEPNTFGTISLDEQQSAFGDISLDANPNAPIAVPVEVAQPRAVKAHFGLGDQSPGFDRILNDISNGQEDQLRQNVAKQYDMYLQLQKTAALQHMAQQGADANIDQAKALIAYQPNTSPDTVFEKTYAQQYLKHVAANDFSTATAALNENPEVTNRLLDATENIVANQEGFKRVVEDSDQLEESRRLRLGSTEKLQSFLYSGIPFRDSALLRNIFTQTSSLLSGDNLDEQITYLWSLPSEQAIPLFKKTVKALEGLDPSLANEFAHLVTEFSEQHRLDKNISNFVDATIVGGPLYKFAKKLAGAIRGNAPKTVNVGNTLEAIGDTEKAAEVKAVEIIKAKEQPFVMPVMDRGYDPLGQKLDLTSILPSDSNPRSLMTPGNLGDFSREKALRIVGDLERQNTLISDTMGNIVRPVRTTSERLQEGLKETQVSLKDQFPHVQDTVLDHRTSGVHPWEHIRSQDTPTNVDYVAMNIGKGGKVERLPNDLGFPLGPVDEGNIKSTLKNAPKRFLTSEEAAWGETVIGRQDASLFKTYAQADKFAQEQLGLHFEQYRTMQGPGDKYYISVVKPVDETSKGLRNLALETNNTNSESLLHSVMGLGYVRTPAGQVAAFLRNNRLLATVGQSKLHAMIKKLAQPIDALRQYPTGGKTVGTAIFGKTSYNKLLDVLNYYNMFQDYSKPMSRGMYPTSLGQLSKDWRKVTGHVINAREATAFWTAVKINDFDWTLRNYNLHRDFARQGIEHVAIPHPTEEGVYTKPFLGKVIKNEDFPWSNPEDASLAIYKDSQYSRFMKNTVKVQDTEETKSLKAWIDRPSVKITQLAVPEGEPLKDVVGFNPHFVISEDIQRTPLPIKLVDHNPGGHVIYPASHYTKQPVIEQGPFGNFFHYGDKTLAAWTTRAQAERYTPRLDEFRKMIKAGASDAELEKYAQKNFAEDYEFWKGKFVGPNAFFSLDHPLVATRQGTSTFSSSPGLKAQYKGILGQDVISYPDSSYSLSKGIDKSFLQDRDGPLQTIVGKGINPWTPEYHLQTARTINPMYSVERGVYNAIRGLYLNDVKVASVEQWIKQYAPILKDAEGGLDKVYRNPYYQFYHGELNESVDPIKVQSALNARRNLKNLLKTSSDLQEDIDVINETLVKGLYGAGTPDSTINWVAAKDWNMIRHPIDYLRSASSNLIFGHYNPVQGYKQSMGALQAIFMDPVYGYQGAAAALLHNLYRIGEVHLPDNVRQGVMKILDKAAILGGWKKGEFQSSVEAMERVGFDKVGREVAWRDSISGDKLFGTGYQNYLDKSYVFFNWGDRNNRMVAWHMAYKRFINDYPELVVNGVVDDRNLGRVLNRADALGKNMTKESNSALQKGPLGPLTQFRSFQMRIFEQFMGGKRGGGDSYLTFGPAQKLREFLASAITYGVPVTASAYLLPMENLYDDMKEYLTKNGIVDPSKPEEIKNWIRAFHDGLLDHIFFMATGKHYNVAKSYGPGADQSLSKALNEGVSDVLSLAPAGSTLESIFKASIPFMAAVKTAQNPANETFKITSQDIMDVLRNIKTVDVGYNMYMAAHLHMFVGKNKQIVDNKMDNMDIFMLQMGLTKQVITDARLGQALAHDQSVYEDKQSKAALEEYRNMIHSMSIGDMKMGDLYLARANVYLNALGDVSQKKKDDIFKQAMSESPTLIERVNELLYSPNRIPPSQIPARLRIHFGIEVNK